MPAIPATISPTYQPHRGKAWPKLLSLHPAEGRHDNQNDANAMAFIVIHAQSLGDIFVAGTYDDGHVIVVSTENLPKPPNCLDAHQIVSSL
jgi:hypothetical protein